MSHTYASKVPPKPAAKTASTSPLRAAQPQRILQRKCACGGEAGFFGQCTECQKGQRSAVQARPDGRRESATVPPIVHEVLHSSGQPLDATTRAYMEPRFGHDFSAVRVHADARAAEAASSINAKAFTSNRSIVFGAGEYSSQTEAGRSLVAHELTHVVQQQAGFPLKDWTAGGDAHEQQANNASREIVVGGPVRTLTDAYQATPGSTVGAWDPGLAIQRQALPETSTTKAPHESAPVGTIEDPQKSDPLMIEASVGAKGANRSPDVAKVQARLLAVGLLSDANIAAEFVQTANLTNANESGITDSADSLAVTTHAPSPPEGSLDAPVPRSDSSLTITIAAIRKFQQALFRTEDVDRNIGPDGPTWRALCRSDASSVAKMMVEWSARIKQVEADAAIKLKADADRKLLEASRESLTAEQQRKTLPGKLLASYAKFIPNTSTYVALDENGLAGALASYAKTNGGIVLSVFGLLDYVDTDDVAYAMTSAASDEELGTFDHTVLKRLKIAMATGWESAEEKKEVKRLDGILGAPASLVGNQRASKSRGPLTRATKLSDPDTGDMEETTVDGKTLAERIKQIHLAYDKFFVPRTVDCLVATRGALEKMGWTVGNSSENFVTGAIGDAGLTEAQSRSLLAALLKEVENGIPVAIGVNYKAGSRNVDKATDHWLYIVASTIDDSGQPVLVAYENVTDAASSKITDGNIVLFRADEMGRLYHGAYFPSSKKSFSTEQHVVVNFRPARRMAKQ